MLSSCNDRIEKQERKISQMNEHFVRCFYANVVYQYFKN